MRILVTGLNHRSAPLDVREVLSLSRAQLPEALLALKGSLGKGVILSTCNRTEVYTVAGDAHLGQQTIGEFLERQFGVELADIQPYLYTLEQEAAVRHLFRVTSSLDSLIIGESEVLGQVREAYSTATKQGTAGGTLARLFHEALRVGKRARTETAIGRNALSVSRACVEMARRTLGDLRDKSALVVGVGDAGRLAAVALHDAALRSLVVANRTMAHAQDLADQLDAQVAPLDQLPELLSRADIVVSSTGAPDFLITTETVREAMSSRSERPLFLIDVAMPRDIHPEAAEVPGVTLATIHDLEMVAEANRREREAEAMKVERLVEEEVGRFQLWWDSLQVQPTVSAIRRQAEAVRATEVRRVLERLPDLSEQDQQHIEAMSKALIKKILHRPTRSLSERNDLALTQAARELYKLDDE